MQGDALFGGSFSAHPSLARRLADQFKEATREFCDNPQGYIASAIKGDSTGGHRRKMLLRLGLAIAITLYAIMFSLTLIFWAFNAKHAAIAREDREITVIPLPSFNPQDTVMKKGDRDAHGGGGGGNGESTPASLGAPPPFSADAAIIAPTTKPPLNPPVLPVLERLLGDPSQNVKRDEFLPTGLPDGVPGPPSDGPGSDGGIGSGNKGGAGSGTGPGFGPGKDGNRGGGENNGLAGRPGREAAIVVDTKPVAMNEPRPNYTEEARQHKVQGVVRARVLIGSDGLIKQVRIITGLPDGLNEEAIRAAMQMRFRPALKSGQAVAYWITLDVEFNLR